MRSIAVINQKGGCGKTITAVNLSAFLAGSGRMVLLIDMDPQGHATLGLQKDPAPFANTISNVLLRGADKRLQLTDVACSVLPNLNLVPADLLLSSVPEKLATVFGRENRLAEALAEIQTEYDYAIIDSPPGVGLLTFNVLMACSEAIIPIDPSFFSLHGIAKLLETIDVLQHKTGHRIAPRALVTLYTGRSEFVKEVVEDVRKHMGDRVFRTIIRYSVKLAEAASRGLPISECSRRCAGFEDYRMLAGEIMQQEEELPVLERRGEAVVRDKASNWLLERITASSAPVSTEAGVLFTLEAPEAQRVQLAGDFNAWIPEGSEMQFSSGIWRKMLALAPGRYRYRYVVDGHWQADPRNSRKEPSPYGDYDSVIVLEEGRSGK
jgi:chromosome partitioning protein